jgi:hypothetical protein
MGRKTKFTIKKHLSRGRRKDPGWMGEQNSHNRYRMCKKTKPCINKICKKINQKLHNKINQYLCAIKIGKEIQYYCLVRLLKVSFSVQAQTPIARIPRPSSCTAKEKHWYLLYPDNPQPKPKFLVL